MFAGLRAIPEDQAAKFRAAIEKNRLAEREEIEMDRARAREEAQAERQQMIAEQNAKLDAIRAKQAENLRKAAAEIEKAPSPRTLGDAMTKQVAASMGMISVSTRGLFGSDNARQVLGGGQGIAEKQVKVQERIAEQQEKGNAGVEALKSLFKQSAFYNGFRVS